MLKVHTLKKEHKKSSKEIKDRLNEFKDNAKKMGENELFLELCFCICTPQSKATKVAEVIKKDNLKVLLSGSENDLIKLLRANTRFHNNKSRYIIHARKYIKNLKKLHNNPIDARKFLVENIKGIGYKEASHFLRNIGYRNISIIDRHIIDLMFQLGVFKENRPPKNWKEYISMEEEMREFSKKQKIDMDELDLLLWSLKTGFVFK